MVVVVRFLVVGRGVLVIGCHVKGCHKPEVLISEEQHDAHCCLRRRIITAGLESGQCGHPGKLVATNCRAEVSL